MSTDDDSRVPQREHRIPADSLRYTRQGLCSRTPITLDTGRHNRIVVVRPERRRAVATAAGGFPLESAYPLPATLALFWTFAPRSAAFAHPAAPVDAPPDGIFQVYGHGSASGDEAYNKQLSDRRAKVGLALLLGDPEALRQVADEEDWGPQHAQAMLRLLACDPGAIDGEIGDRTESALAQFQARYNAAVYHRRAPQRAPSTALEVNGRWDEPTKAALLEAFVVAQSAHVPPEHQHPTHPANGCSEYNRLTLNGDTANRRITLVHHAALPPFHDTAPCVVGDDGPCAVVDDAPNRCLWFREHVTEDAPGPVQFFDPRWLWLGEDRYLLSAVTTAPPQDVVEFEVFERDPQSTVTDGRLGNPRSTTLEAMHRLGIVQAVWVADAASTDALGRPAMDGVPIFRVRHRASGVWTSAPWPQTDNVRVLVGSTATDVLQRSETFRLRTTDGAYDQRVSFSSAVAVSPHRVAVEFSDVPMDAKVCLSFGIGDAAEIELFSDAKIERLRENCTEGNMCREVPVPTPPDAHAVQDNDDHLDAVSNLLRDPEVGSEHAAW